MTGYFVGHWRKKRRFATSFYSWSMYFTRESPLLPPATQLHTCHPEPKPRAKEGPARDLILNFCNWL